MSTASNWPLYNCIDSAVTYKVWNTIEPDIDSQGYRQLYEDTMSLFPPIIFMQTVGLRIDKESLQREKDRVTSEIEKNEKELHEVCGFELNPNSPKQCQQYFYGILGHKPYLSDRGTITVDEKALSRLTRKGVKEAKLVLTIRNLRKLLGTYLEVATDWDGRIRTSFNPRGATTGRLSSSQTIFGTGLNFQNLDPRFKAFIVSDPGRIFISMDKAQAEWVITAYVCGDPKMISAIENKEDIHIRTAHEMTGIPKDLIKRESQVVRHATDRDLILELRHKHLPELMSGNWNFLPLSMSIRQCGKKSNHGCNYIEGYRRFALENEIPEAEGKVYVDTYRNTYMNLPIWWDRIGAKVNRDRTVENLFGHKRRFLGEPGHELTKQAVAYIPQSTSVWVLNYAMRDMYNDDTEPFNDLCLHAQVHDELLMSFPVNKWELMAQAILSCESYMDPLLSHEARDFRIGTELSIGLNWGEYNEEDPEENPQGMRKVPLLRKAKELEEVLEGTYAKIIR